jgi:riboflavin kinase
MRQQADIYTMRHQADIYNLPDFQFANYCLEKYGLNKGIYNTIDQWMYANGYRRIQQRREALLSFLEFMAAKAELQDREIRFGKGMLVESLSAYMN